MLNKDTASVNMERAHTMRHTLVSIINAAYKKCTHSVGSWAKMLTWTGEPNKATSSIVSSVNCGEYVVTLWDTNS